MPSDTKLIDALSKCLQDDSVLKILREKLIEPAIKSALDEALRMKDNEISELKSEVDELKNQLNQSQQASRRKNVCLTGIKE